MHPKESAISAVLAGTPLPERDPLTGKVRMSPARLSRRDRAALQLALSCTRAHSASDGVWPTLINGDVVSHEIYDRLRDYGVVTRRRHRAHLALILRLVLRCDAWTRADKDGCDWPAGSDPRATLVCCSRCGDRLYAHEVGEELSGKCCGARAERVRPLWEQAPATRAR